MINFCRVWNALNILSSLSLLISYSECRVIDSQRYPHFFSKCCESKGNASADRNSTSSYCGPRGSSGLEGSEIIFLPKRLFPQMSPDLEHVELELRNSVDELQCEEGQDYLDVSIDLVDHKTSLLVDHKTSLLVDHKTSLPINVGVKEASAEVAFSGNNFLAADGYIYNRRHFCVSRRMSNKTHLVIKTCKKTCSPQRPCIARCCGGHRSILNSPLTSYNKSLLGFCSTQTLEKKSWSPWTSNILRTDNRTRFYQTRYTPRPHFQEEDKLSDPDKLCTLFRVKLENKLSLALLDDGRLQLTKEDTTQVLENFCIDGINVGTDESSQGDKRETPKDDEIVVVYSCSHHATVEEPISLRACRAIAYPLDKLLQLPKSLFQNTTFEKKDKVEVRLTTGKADESQTCFEKYKNLILQFNNTSNLFFNRRGWLFLHGSYYDPSRFCIRSVSHNQLGLRVCLEKNRIASRLKSSTRDWRKWFIRIIKLLALAVAALFYVAIALVFILRKDKELVLRCSIATFSISMTLTYVLFPIVIYLHANSFPLTAITIIGVLTIFFYVYGFSWMTVLCYDVWHNIVYNISTFLRPGRKSSKRLWGYIAFTLTLTTFFLGVLFGERFLDFTRIYFARKKAITHLLGYLLYGSAIILICLNFLLYLTTTIKLWIAQHSSDIKNQKKTFLMYLKLFILMGLRWITDFAHFFKWRFQESRLVEYTTYVLLFVHPIVLFFFLVWDAETRKYFKTNYPQVKRVLDVIGWIGYPVRKCWGLCRRCKRPDDEGTDGNGTAEPPHNSTHMYVHTRRIPNNPK